VAFAFLAYFFSVLCLQCFDTVGWAAGRAYGLQKNRVVGCWCGCLEQGADLHMAQLMPLPLTVSCFSKIQIGFTFLVPAHLDSPGKMVVLWLCVCSFQFTSSYNGTLKVGNAVFGSLNVI